MTLTQDLRAQIEKLMTTLAQTEQNYSDCQASYQDLKDRHSTVNEDLAHVRGENNRVIEETHAKNKEIFDLKQERDTKNLSYDCLMTHAQAQEEELKTLRETKTRLFSVILKLEGLAT